MRAARAPLESPVFRPAAGVLGPLAQSAEQGPLKPKVTGSIPVRPTDWPRCRGCRKSSIAVASSVWFATPARGGPAWMFERVGSTLLGPIDDGDHRPTLRDPLEMHSPPVLLDGDAARIAPTHEPEQVIETARGDNAQAVVG